jgi:hypothetical protein
MLIGLPLAAAVYLLACRTIDLERDRRNAATEDFGLDAEIGSGLRRGRLNRPRLTLEACRQIYATDWASMAVAHFQFEGRSRLDSTATGSDNFHGRGNA